MTSFGPFTFDYERRQLFRDGQEIHLTPKAFRLLSLLIDAAPRVVPKTELHARLWPNGIVTDSTLVGLIKEIRRALGDDNPDGRMIRTAQRVGYAFQAPVTRGPLLQSRIARWLIASNRRFALVDGENVIGRDPEAAIRLDYPTVSRRHARLVVGEAGATLEDLGSKNGTKVNGKRLVSAVPLRSGDSFACGQLLVTYKESSGGISTATHVSQIEDRSPPRR